MNFANFSNVLPSRGFCYLFKLGLHMPISEGKSCVTYCVFVLDEISNIYSYNILTSMIINVYCTTMICVSRHEMGVQMLRHVNTWRHQTFPHFRKSSLFGIALFYRLCTAGRFYPCWHLEMSSLFFIHYFKSFHAHYFQFLVEPPTSRT